MKKRYGFVLAALLLAASSLTAYAESSSGGPWKVAFTREGELESGFATSQLADVVYGMQPGDDAKITLELVNQNSASTEWYMTNKILSSLEDSASGASGGAYTYRLAYTGQDGKEKVLFSSDTVGGTGTDAGEGLHSISSALEDYFYLDTLASGQKGTVTLLVALDGETQGNSYQGTLADLSMNFAVQVGPEGSRDGGTGGSGGGGSEGGQDSGTGGGQSGGSRENRTSQGTATRVVKTGDESRLGLFVGLTAASGILLLVFALLGVAQRRKQEKEVQ